jgi:hypothetical protein
MVKKEWATAKATTDPLRDGNKKDRGKGKCRSFDCVAHKVP